MDHSTISINYQLLKKPRVIFLTAALTITVYQGLFYFHPTNQHWLSSKDFSFLNTLQFILIDQILIECITVFILFSAISLYAKQLKLTAIQNTRKQRLRYFLKFLPLFLGVYFLFSPFTVGVRFVYHFFPTLPTKEYFKDYFFLNAQLYITYLLPVFVMGYGVLGYNLSKLIHQQKNTSPTSPTEATLPQVASKKHFTRYIDAKDAEGEALLELNQVVRFQKIERKYYAIHQEGQYVISKNIQELEAMLDPEQFIRINRSVIINLGFLKNYAFWENEKYIVRLKDNSEFVMSRNRYHKIKQQLSLKNESDK